MKPPTVWGIITMKPHGITLDQPAHVSQCRAIVAAPSKAAAMRALNGAGFYMTAHTFNGYAGETGNDREVTAATTQPGHVLITSVQGCGEFVDLTERAEKQRAEQEEQHG